MLSFSPFFFSFSILSSLIITFFIAFLLPAHAYQHMERCPFICRCILTIHPFFMVGNYTSGAPWMMPDIKWVSAFSNNSNTWKEVLLSQTFKGAISGSQDRSLVVSGPHETDYPIFTCKHCMPALSSSVVHLAEF